MNKKTNLGSKKEPSTLVRPQYSPGLLLNDDDLTQAVDYTRELSRMLFKSLLGCGVICGLLVDKEIVCGKLVVKVAPGVALDCHGDPVHVAKPADVTIDPACGVDVPSRLWVLLRRYDKHCAPRAAVCSPDDDDDAASVCTRIRDGFEVSVAGAVPACACNCPPPQDPNDDPAPEDPAGGADFGPCHDDHYAGKCSCCGGDCACEWIVLARLDRSTADMWTVSHAVRRFIRPVLMADPQVVAERAPPSPAPVPTPTP